MSAADASPFVPAGARPPSGFPDLGLGVGLRARHLPEYFETWPAIDFLEVLTENYLEESRRSRDVLARIAARYPLVLHGVSLSIGSSDPLDLRYVARVRRLADEVRAHWVSDHLCWTGVLGRTTHDLLPMRTDAASLRRVVDRVRRVQDALQRPLLLENPSTYLQVKGSTIPEEEFLARLCERADCFLLVDVNNVYVNAVNHGLDPERYLDALPGERIVQLHLAGHRDRGTHLLDTHDAPVADAVWDLYVRLVRRIGTRATLLEWDARIPPLADVHREVLRARERLTGRSSHVEVA